MEPRDAEIVRRNMDLQREKLLEIIVSEFGLLDILLQNGALRRIDKERIQAETTGYKKNEQLLDHIFKNNRHQELIAALSESSQIHVVNWIKGNGERRDDFGLDWPLTDRENEILDQNEGQLVEILDTSHLIIRMYSTGVINGRQKEFVESKPTNYDRNEALLYLIRRMSLKGYDKFIGCLRDSNQEPLSEIFEIGGAIVPVHASLDGDSLDEAEEQIVDQMVTLLLSNTASDEQANRLLAKLQLKVIAARRDQNVVLYTRCGREEELDYLSSLTGYMEMKNSFEQLFNLLLRKTRIKVRDVNIVKSNIEKAKKFFAPSKHFKESTNVTDQEEAMEEQEEQLEHYCAGILKKLRDFNVHGFETTNCIFTKNEVEICYILKDSEPVDQEKLKQNLAKHLEIKEPETLKLTKLRERPVYKETASRPGDRVHKSECCIGAFVNVQGKGIHALMCGHGKAYGDIFRSNNGDRVRVVISLQEEILNNEVPVFCDISLGHLDNQTAYDSTITISDGTVLQLNQNPENARDGMEVRLFVNGDRRGAIASTRHYRVDSLGIYHRLIQVLDEQEQPVHVDGESGILIVTNPSGISPNGAVAAGNRVTAVGMLISHEILLFDDGHTRTVSLAAPLTSSFRALRKDPYCEGAEVRFC